MGVTGAEGSVCLARLRRASPVSAPAAAKSGADGSHQEGLPTRFDRRLLGAGRGGGLVVPIPAAGGWSRWADASSMSVEPRDTRPLFGVRPGAPSGAPLRCGWALLRACTWRARLAQVFTVLGDSPKCRAAAAGPSSLPSIQASTFSQGGHGFDGPGILPPCSRLRRPNDQAGGGLAGRALWRTSPPRRKGTGFFQEGHAPSARSPRRLMAGLTAARTTDSALSLRSEVGQRVTGPQTALRRKWTVGRAPPTVAAEDVFSVQHEYR